MNQCVINTMESEVGNCKLPHDFGKIWSVIMGGVGSGNFWRYGTKQVC